MPFQQGGLTAYQSLTRVDISHNNIQQLCHISQCPELKEISLSSNRLQTIKQFDYGMV